jgi:hypothetical protein
VPAGKKLALFAQLVRDETRGLPLAKRFTSVGDEGISQPFDEILSQVMEDLVRSEHLGGPRFLGLFERGFADLMTLNRCQVG